jgi:hypothetical protein
MARRELHSTRASRVLPADWMRYGSGEGGGKDRECREENIAMLH